jgi:hypothetical protein
VIFWAAISWYSACPITTLNGRITASDYEDILVNHVHPTFRMLFPNNDAIFQDDASPIHTARRIESSSGEREDSLRQLPWPAQSPALNITEPLWLVSESRVRSRFRPP